MRFDWGRKGEEFGPKSRSVKLSRCVKVERNEESLARGMDASEFPNRKLKILIESASALSECTRFSTRRKAPTEVTTQVEK